MRTMILAAGAMLALSGAPAWSKGEVEDDGSEGRRVTEAPLPLAGAGMLGFALLGGAGGLVLLVRRRQPQHG